MGGGGRGGIGWFIWITLAWAWCCCMRLRRNQIQRQRKKMKMRMLNMRKWKKNQMTKNIYWTKTSSRNQLTTPCPQWVPKLVRFILLLLHVHNQIHKYLTTVGDRSHPMQVTSKSIWQTYFHIPWYFYIFAPLTLVISDIPSTNQHFWLCVPFLYCSGGGGKGNIEVAKAALSGM